MGLEDTSDKYYILYIFTGLTSQMWQLFTFVLDVIFLFCFVCFLINVPPCSALGKQTIKPVVNLTLFSLMIAEKTAWRWILDCNNRMTGMKRRTWKESDVGPLGPFFSMKQDTQRTGLASARFSVTNMRKAALQNQVRFSLHLFEVNQRADVEQTQFQFTDVSYWFKYPVIVSNYEPPSLPGP